MRRKRGRPAPGWVRGCERLLLATLVFATIACAPAAETPIAAPANREVGPTVSETQTYSYTRDIQPLLETRCVACHGCTDAPCQLKLTSAQGLQRGATKLGVYDATRLLDADPTRLFIDARSTAQSRSKGFHSVFNDRGGPSSKNLEQSVLYRMLELGRQHPLAPGAPVPRSRTASAAGRSSSIAPHRRTSSLPATCTNTSSRRTSTSTTSRQGISSNSSAPAHRRASRFATSRPDARTTIRAEPSIIA